MEKFYSFIIICLLLCSCNSTTIKQEIVEILDFPIQDTLMKYKIFPHETIGALRVCAIKDYLLIQKRKSSYYFDVYSKKDSLKKIELCYKGQGPMDFIAPFYSGQFEKNTFLIFDRAKSVFSKIDIDKSVLENKIIIDTMLNFSSFLDTQAREMFMIDTENYLYCADYEDCDFYLLNRDQSMSKKIKNDYKLTIPIYKHQLSQKTSTYKNHKIASVYYSFPKIDFISIDEGKVFKSMSFLEKISINKDNIGKYLDHIYFDDIDSTNDYVYCLCNNSKTPNSNSKILVFDWNGAPIALFYLPSYYTSFSIEQNGKVIYTLNWESEQMSIFDIDLEPIQL